MTDFINTDEIIIDSIDRWQLFLWRKYVHVTVECIPSVTASVYTRTPAFLAYSGYCVPDYTHSHLHQRVGKSLKQFEQRIYTVFFVNSATLSGVKLLYSIIYNRMLEKKGAPIQ